MGTLKTIGMHSCLSGGTVEEELHRTADILVSLSKDEGVYFVVAFLLDSSYDTERIGRLLPILEKTRGAIRSKKGGGK